MTQDEKWYVRYNEVVTFIDTNKRNPSRHRIEEHDHLNWLKAKERGGDGYLFHRKTKLVIINS